MNCVVGRLQKMCEVSSADKGVHSLVLALSSGSCGPVISRGDSFSWGKESASEMVLSCCNAPYEIPTLREALISEVSVVH